MLELISLHVPKCAGTSVLEAWRAVYGESLFEDYQQDLLIEPSSPFNQDAQGFLQRAISGELVGLEPLHRCVHGHFYIRKYDKFPNALRTTVLREPIDRLLSQYFFWLAQPVRHTLRQRLVDEQMDIIQFSQLPWLRYYYTRQYFRDVDMASFDLIGEYTKLADWARAIGSLCGQTLELPKSNINTGENYARRKEAIRNDRTTMARLRDILREDIDFYERYGNAA